MAVSTSNYFKNSIQGIPQVGADFNIYDTHSTPRYALGTRMQRHDGNEYVYCHFGADTGQGLISAVDASESSLVETDNIVVAPASAQTTSDGTIGSKFAEITLASVTENQYAGGYLTITDGTGAGYTYRIKGNTATGNPASGNFRIELCEKLQVALDATSDIQIQGCLYANLEAATAGTDACTAGVACSNMDVSVAAYGWVCAKGLCPINVDATDVALGDVVALSADVAGAIYTLNDAVTGAQVAHDEEIIGVAMDTPDDNSYVLVKCNIS